jgi:transposase
LLEESGTETMKEQKRYSNELKSEAVKMCIEQGLPQEEVGRRLGIPKGTIGNWVAGAKAGRVLIGPEELSVTQIMEENRKLKKELAEARMEQEFLRKAAAYFAKASQPGTR